ncbi:MAG: LacI family DNA-binding transcriptional regulator [Aestuariibacter sp.]
MAPQKKALNLKEVAKSLGVSTATVSNAFNRPDQLSEKLRARILKEAAELGYFGPNLAARSLRKGQSDVIAVILADSLAYSFSDPVASQFLQGVSEVLFKHKKQLLLLSSQLDAHDQNSAESLPDGFIFYGKPEGNGIERILRLGKPVIAVDFETQLCPTVNINNQEGARQAALHAISSAEDRVAVLSLSLVDSKRICRLHDADIDAESQAISQRRLAGYLQACQEKRVALPSNLIWHIPVNTPELAEIAANEALTVSPLPNIILCMSDVIALAVIRQAKALNIAIPEQLKVIGFDDIPEASRVTPALASVCQRSIAKGRHAAEALLSGTPIASNELATELVIRASCP